ncbi:cell division protein SufI [Hoeflea sp. IMCC20628]|uniref:multicopper oxidase domain-containing protein n=1 Tax=Hoeflea sp. IMCC20628 TaxID=1620421 RepID=UPI00063BEC9F|nr:multicopper oxidase domain-containing protein [Hoeflea sp. IMCC20628]AKI01111.1 cell division protein SufI [Hoeflea sp. IMCC20628]
MKRRQFLTTSAAALAMTQAGFGFGGRSARAASPSSQARLKMPPLLDTRQTGRLALSARAGSLSLSGGPANATAGFSQDYLGPTIIMQNGPLAADVENTLEEAISVHWHGLLVPGDHDGGPHVPISPGQRWTPDMNIAQQPGTAWYHSHIHGRTAQQVYSGLAGVIQVTDGRDAERGLPVDYGVDDLTLVLQDRRVDGDGRMVYDPSMMDVMHGFMGNRMLVNGQVGAVAAVPAGLVRLRLLNGSNARSYDLSFDDGRLMHLVATDSGFLPAPVALTVLSLSPGERVEILVDFASGGAPVLMSGIEQPFGVLDFAVDDTMPARITVLPDGFGSALEDLSGTEMRTRELSLDMGMGGMMMGGGGGFAINQRAFAMDRIDLEVALGSVERWIIRSTMIPHPFHVHGVQFRVVRENGAPPRPQNNGWKDTVLVPGETEIIMRFDQPASRDKPFMFHCHILEHEDAGMMGQFTVS